MVRKLKYTLKSLQLMYGVDCRALNVVFISLLFLAEYVKLLAPLKHYKTQFTHILFSDKHNLHYEFSTTRNFLCLSKQFVYVVFTFFQIFHQIIKASNPISTHSLPENDCFLSQVWTDYDHHRILTTKHFSPSNLLCNCANVNIIMGIYATKVNATYIASALLFCLFSCKLISKIESKM